jgi:CxxC-x17-CxxC domain-containing protein
MVVFSDRTLSCRDCGTEFVFSAGEQEFFQAKGLQNEPGRCPACRVAYKQARGIVDERPQREYFLTTCAGCGQEARVPFVPRNERPVYCSTCFDQVRQASA